VASTPAAGVSTLRGGRADVSILKAMFEHNRWANLRVAEAVAAVDDACLDASCQGTAGTVRETLMHIAGAEQRYVARLSDRPPTYGERDGWPGAEKLRQTLEESGSWLIELAGSVPQERVLTTEYQGQTHQLPVTTIFVQAINHATEHRSQIATILTQQGVEPPDMSGWAFGT
jgi:uncharacterized damage-inducible protein DinB